MIGYLLHLAYAQDTLADQQDNAQVTELPKAHPTPLVIDTDMAVDDWLAIAYLLQHPLIDVRAITITGDTPQTLNACVRNAMNLLALAGKPEIPVAAGRPQSLGSAALQPGWRDRVDAMLGIALPSNPLPSSPLSAVDLLVRAIATADQPCLLTLGPLTNVADLLAGHPATASRLEHIWIMGGAVDVRGNLDAGIATENDTAEWNIYVDPQAAADVVNSGLPITMIPLDATNTAPLTVAFYKRLAADRATPLAEFVHHVLAYERLMVESGGWYFWDPLAAAAITDPSVIGTTPMPITVVTDLGREEGRTRHDPAGTTINVATTADAAHFERVFIDTLNGRALAP